MPAEEAARVFISYARKDANDLAQQLHGDLAEAGLQPWLDIVYIPSGAGWARSIEQGVDACDLALILLTPRSFESNFCRAELYRARRKDKRIIPILAQP